MAPLTVMRKTIENDLRATRLTQEERDLEWQWQKRILNWQIIDFSSSNVGKLEFARLLQQDFNPETPIDILEIQGHNKWPINNCLQIFKLNPRKLILVNTHLPKDSGHVSRLDDPNKPPSQPVEMLRNKMEASGKWRFCTTSSHLQALKAENPIRSWIPFKRWHTVYEVQIAPHCALKPTALPVKKSGIHGVHERH